MARGFDSKNVEEQQSMAFAAKKEGRKLDAAEQQKLRDRANLELQRSKLKADIAASPSERHRQMLESALADIEKRLSAFVG